MCAKIEDKEMVMMMQQLDELNRKPVGRFLDFIIKESEGEVKKSPENHYREIEISG